MGEAEVVTFLKHLAVRRKVAAWRDATASTQNLALGALLFLDRLVLNRPLARLDDRLVRARTPERLPTVFSRKEARAVLARLDGNACFTARASG